MLTYLLVHSLPKSPYITIFQETLGYLSMELVQMDGQEIGYDGCHPLWMEDNAYKHQQQ